MKTEEWTRDLLNALLAAETESDVHAVLGKRGLLDEEM